MGDVFDDQFAVTEQRQARNRVSVNDADDSIQSSRPTGANEPIDESQQMSAEQRAELERETKELNAKLGRRRLSFVGANGAATTATVQFHSYAVPVQEPRAQSASHNGEEDDSDDAGSVVDMISNVSFSFVRGVNLPTTQVVPDVGHEGDVTAPAVGTDDSSLVSIVYKDLCVSAGEKQLLFGITGELTSGLIAIMGPSGSGKTTLMNAIAARMDPNMSISKGEARINGLPVTKGNVKQLIGYVMQDDILLENLSVATTLRYACALRFGHKLSAEEQAARIATVAEMMSLGGCMDQPVGSNLSGGERKRIAVALELLSFPKVLFLDEPTSSLDSVDALHVVRCLRKLVDEFQLTVVCTIHQPQFKVFSTFDRLILLSAGRLLYDAPVGRASEFCAAARMPVLQGVNPADQIMYVATRYETDMKSMSPELPSGAVDLRKGENRTNVAVREMAPRLHQFKILFARNAAVYWRRKHMILVAVVQTIIISIGVGFAFRPSISLESRLASTRLSVLAFCCINQGAFGAISALSAFGAERVICLRERAAGLYHAFPYFAAKVAFELLSRAPFPALFSVIVFWILGLSTTAEDFFYFTFVMWATNIAAVSLAMATSTVARVNELACILLPMFLEITRLFSSFFIAPVDANPIIGWIRFFSFLNYGYSSIVQQHGETKVYTCPLVNGTQPQCRPFASGKQQYVTLGLDDLTYGGDIAGLWGYSVVALTITYLAMRFLVW